MLRVLTATCFALLVIMSAGCADSGDQPYPNRPVHFVVGFGVGGPDTTARLLAAQLSEQTGRRFLVENKPGSTGVIAAEYVATSAPDGYTLLVAPASLASLPSLKRDLPFDVPASFIPISQIASSEASFLVVPPSLPVGNLQEFIEYARSPDNRVTYASTGIGTGSHLRMALFSSANDVPMQHVPFKSPGEAVVSVMGGETQALFLTTTQALPLIKSGKIRALAYDYSSRAEFLPDVPTMAEAGSAATQLDSGWHGVFAPAGTPEAITSWLESEIRAAIAVPEVTERLTGLGLTPVGNTAPEFLEVVTKAVEEMGAAARAASIQPL